jgi:hypothetical protein
MAKNQMDFITVDAPAPFLNAGRPVTLSQITPNGPILFLGRFNEDNDGAPNCYGPSELGPLENLANAASPFQNFGRNNNFDWVGLLSRTKPDAQAEGLVIDTSDPLLEARGSSGKSMGRWPVVQQRAGAKGPDGKQLLPTGPRPGFYISTTSELAHPGLRETNPNRYFNADTVPYGAITLGVTEATGVSMGDFGLVIRKKTGASAGFFFADSGGGKDVFKVGECSRFLLRTVSHRDNGDDVCFILFPGSRIQEHPTIATVGMIDQTVRALMTELAKVDNPESLPRFFAMGADLEKWWADGDHDKPFWTTEYNNIVKALSKWGYNVPPIGDFPSKKDLERTARMA